MRRAARDTSYTVGNSNKSDETGPTANFSSSVGTPFELAVVVEVDVVNPIVRASISTSFELAATFDFFSANKPFRHLQ